MIILHIFSLHLPEGLKIKIIRFKNFKFRGKKAYGCDSVVARGFPSDFSYHKSFISLRRRKFISPSTSPPFINMKNSSVSIFKGATMNGFGKSRKFLKVFLHTQTIFFHKYEVINIYSR